MRARETGGSRPLPVPLQRAREQFERWRRTRQRRTVPEGLWARAAKLARTHGVHRTAQALRLNYYSLKKRVEGEDPGRGEAARATFVEVVPAGAGGTAAATGSRWLVELEDSGGQRLRIEVEGGTFAELAALSTRLWRGE